MAPVAGHSMPGQHQTVPHCIEVLRGRIEVLQFFSIAKSALFPREPAGAAPHGLSCSECERLLFRYCEATRLWGETNRELAESALKYETKMFSRCLGKCQLKLELSRGAAEEYREHVWAAHNGNGIQP